MPGISVAHISTLKIMSVLNFALPYPSFSLPVQQMEARRPLATGEYSCQLGAACAGITAVALHNAFHYPRLQMVAAISEGARSFNGASVTNNMIEIHTMYRQLLIIAPLTTHFTVLLGGKKN